jgi:hypothetical protein
MRISILFVISYKAFLLLCFGHIGRDARLLESSGGKTRCRFPVTQISLVVGYCVLFYSPSFLSVEPSFTAPT